MLDALKAWRRINKHLDIPPKKKAVDPMKKNRNYRRLPILAIVLLTSLGSANTQAQDVPSQRDIRGYVPPDQLVSFRPETPFSQFVDFLNPIFERVNGKAVIDPESRQLPIGISIAGMQYFDAFEVVLNYNRLVYRETDRFFIVEEAHSRGCDGGGVA